MRDFFSLDGGFQKYGGFIADTMILSIMWLIFSIPFLTIGASTSALYYVATRRIANREGYITSDFWEAFKLNFVKSTVLWLIFCFVFFLLVINITASGELGQIRNIVLPVQIVVLLQLVFMFIYVFPIVARFEMDKMQIVKSCFFMANRHLLTTITCTVLLMATIFFLIVAPIFLFVAPGAYGVLSSYLLVRVFKRYRPEMDKDPQLELREIEAKKEEAKKMKTIELQNKNGMKVKATNVGCAIMQIVIPKNNVDIVQGFDTANEYMDVAHPFFGVVVGRFANRIENAKFTLDGKEFILEQNDGNHHLHGGNSGFATKIWSVVTESSDSVTFSYNSPDGDSGYPGDLYALVKYSLSNDNVLRIDYTATTNSKTICNLTNHSYFNLSGFAAKSIYDHVLMLHASSITECSEELIPTGKLVNVQGTPFDFRTEKAIGKDLDEAAAVSGAGGYDHNFVLDGEGLAAVVYSPTTGIRMSITTNSPGIQLYTSNMLDGAVTGKGARYDKHSSFCLETQIFPNAINIPSFPSCIVEKDSPQSFYTEFKFEW